MSENFDHLPTGYQTAVYQVTTWAAMLDHEIELTIAALLASKAQVELPRYLIKSVSSSKFPELLQCILMDRFSKHESEIKTLIASITTARKERNDVIHSMHSISESGDLKLSINRIFRKSRTEKKTLHELQELASKLKTLNRYLEHLTDWALREMRVLRQESHEQPPLQIDSPFPLENYPSRIARARERQQ